MQEDPACAATGSTTDSGDPSTTATTTGSTSDPSTTSPTTEPPTTDPVTSDPATTDPTTTDPTTTEPSTTGPTTTDPSTTGTTGVGQCENMMLDGDESDVDCGGSCGPCADGLLCGDDDDCMTMGGSFCHPDAGKCVPAHCGDGAFNDGQETYLDCGGECENTCLLGFPCGDDGDCADPMAMCGPMSGTCILDPLCENGEQDPGETDIDCGGPCGLSCKDAEMCEDGGEDECLGPGECSGGMCFAGECFNQGHDPGLETDIDCGGICGPCDPGQACVYDGDCMGGIFCLDMICQA